MASPFSSADLTQPLNGRLGSHNSYGSHSSSAHADDNDTTAFDVAGDATGDLSMLLTQYDVDGYQLYHRLEVISIIHDLIAVKNDPVKIEKALRDADREEKGETLHRFMWKIPVVPIVCMVLSIIFCHMAFRCRHIVNHGLVTYGIDYVTANMRSREMLMLVVALNTACAIWAAAVSRHGCSHQVHIVEHDHSRATVEKPKAFQSFCDLCCSRIAAVFLSGMVLSTIAACVYMLLLATADTQLGYYTDALCRTEYNMTDSNGDPTGETVGGTQLMEGVLNTGFQEEHNFLLFLRTGVDSSFDAIVKPPTNVTAAAAAICSKWTATPFKGALKRLRRLIWLILFVQVAMLFSIISMYDDFFWTNKSLFFLYDLFGVYREPEVTTCFGFGGRPAGAKSLADDKSTRSMGSYIDDLDKMDKSTSGHSARSEDQRMQDAGYGLPWDDLHTRH